MPTIELRDSREGIEIVSVYISPVTITLDVPQRISAYEIMRLSQSEDVYFLVKEDA